jgi:L-arabinose isomerase
MYNYNEKEIWFFTGSQHLYGEETLLQVEKNSKAIVEYLSSKENIPVKIVFKSVLTTPDSIYNSIIEANSAANCIGIITWMHTFSPAKMWIRGLKSLNKPMAHLHTQFNAEIPWSTIDMDFMNLNQAAHGDREFGFMCTKLGIRRKVIVGHWQDERVAEKLAVWMRVAAAWDDMQGGKIARFGDNMREVAVTEGDKVEAQMKFGFSVYGYGIGDLVKVVNSITDEEVDQLIKEYESKYEFVIDENDKDQWFANLKEGAKIELGMQKFLKDGDFKGFTTNFEDLYGLNQLQGLASQRLMTEGYGFGAEGDWKTAAMLRAVKTMAIGLEGGTSFMEDYTYHFAKDGMKVLGAHMLEVCESIASAKPKLEIHPLGIGGKDNPPRLVFDVPEGPALNITLIDMGNKYRMIVNEVDVVATEAELPKLPVARALWVPKPTPEEALEAWILGGGAHHTVFTQAVTKEYLEDFAEIADIELLMIDDEMNLRDFRNNAKI